MPQPKCPQCNKSVYPMEAVTMQDFTFHKLCFKCQAEECGLKLTLKTANNVGGKIFCEKHKPIDKPTAVTVEGSLSLSNARDAPKIATVNQQKRGDNMENPIQTTVEGNLSLMRAKEAHENAKVLVNNEQKAAPGYDKNLQVADFTLTNAMSAPKVNTVNDQVRPGAGERNAQVADYSLSNAMNAPKVNTVNDQIRDHSGPAKGGIDLVMENAMNAPKVNTVNDQVRPGAGERNAQNFI